MRPCRIFCFSAVALTVAVFIGIGGWLSFKAQPLLLEGEVEVTEIDVAAKLPGRINAVAVRLGQKVRAGELLFTMDSPELEARLTQAQAAQDAAGALRRKAEAGARSQEVRAAWLQFARAHAAADLATQTLQRIERLLAEGVVPQQQRDEVAAQAKAAHAASEAALAMAEMAEEGARAEDIEAASALEQQAGGAVSEVEAFLEETRIHAPAAGEVSSLLIDAGELAPAGYPVITLARMDDLWIVFQVREDLLAGMGVGTVFQATVPALNNRELMLKVDYLAVLGAFATWRATSASGGFDLKTFEVRARPLQATEGLRPGMTVLVSWSEQ